MLEIPSKKSVRRAGSVLRAADAGGQEYSQAMTVLSQWRSLHSYPIRAFQSLIRYRVRGMDSVVIAQRLKRTPSIVRKLQRFSGMDLSRMQDIGGIRVIVKNVDDVYKLHNKLLKIESHEAELPPDDYISEPKSDGYRSLHQRFQYHNPKHPELNGLRIELQIRTRLQHAWATAVEALGVIEKASFKTGEGSEEIKRFFLLTSALFAHAENTAMPSELLNTPIQDIIRETQELEQKLKILSRLESFSVPLKHIKKTSGKASDYQILILDTSGSEPKVEMIAFPVGMIESAENLYKALEKDNRDNDNRDIVLVSAGGLSTLRQAYPNYFLDTQMFVRQLRAILSKP